MERSVVGIGGGRRKAEKENSFDLFFFSLFALLIFARGDFKVSATINDNRFYVETH